MHGHLHHLLDFFDLSPIKHFVQFFFIGKLLLLLLLGLLRRRAQLVLVPRTETGTAAVDALVKLGLAPILRLDKLTVFILVALVGMD